MGGVEEVVSMSGSRITGYVAVHSRETAAAEARDMDRSITFVCSYAPWYDRSKPRKPTGPVVIPLEGFEATDEYRARIAELQAQAEARRRKTSNAAAIIDEARAAIDRMDAEDDAAASSAAAAAPRKYGLDIRKPQAHAVVESNGHVAEPTATSSIDARVAVDDGSTPSAADSSTTVAPSPLDLPILRRNAISGLENIADEEERFHADVAVRVIARSIARMNVYSF